MEGGQLMFKREPESLQVELARDLNAYQTADQHEQLLQGLNPEQRQAVLHKDGPLLILAGAGSGKTKVITHRIAYLVEVFGVNPASILAITFTNKAATEMRERIIKLIGDQTRGMWVGTFHSMLMRILRNHAEVLGFSKRFSIADTDDQLKLIKECCKELDLNDKIFPPKQILHMISSAKNSLQSPQEFKHIYANDHFKSKAAAVYELYAKRLKAADAMDFDDILYFTVELLLKNPEILAFYQERFQYILVDEYQDTNVAQYKCIYLLSRKHQNLAVVGDDDQSIYSFRGADVTNILNFEKDFKNCTTIKLEQNYRSTGAILQAANAVIANNTKRKAKRLWTDKVDGEKLKLVKLPSHTGEAAFIASEINRFVNQEHKFNYQDIVIIYRVNALSRSLEFALRDYGIPHQIYGGLRFYDRKEIKDVVAYLRLIANPMDGLAFTRVINEPKRGIGGVTQEHIFALARQYNVSPIAICQNAAQFPELERAKNKLQSFAQLIYNFQQSLNESPSLAAFVDKVQNESGLLTALINQKDQGKEGMAERVENMREMLSDIIEFEKSPVPLDLMAMEANIDEDMNWTMAELLDAFLERAALSASIDDSDKEEGVRLMSIHSAKGLEANVVFIVGMEDGVFPGYRSIGSESEMQEERRLVYVAITRAKQYLYITYTVERLLYGQNTRPVLSRFVNEIPAACLEFIKTGSAGDSKVKEDYLAVHGNFKSSQENANQLKYARSVLGAVGAGSTFNKGGKTSAGSSPTTGTNLGSSFSKLPQFGASTSSANRGGAATSSVGNNSDGSGIDPLKLRVGQTVCHPRFGEGQLLEIVPTAGDAILKVAFANGQKRFMAKTSGLRLKA